MSVGLYSGTSGLALGVGLWSGVPGFWSGAAGLIDGLGAALDLNFLTGTLPSTITFSRGTQATLTDSTGKITYAPNNLLTNSESFEATAWVKNAATVSANSSTAPDGTSTADSLIEDTTNAVHRTLQPFTAVISVPYVCSFYVKAIGSRRFYLNCIALMNSSALFDLTGNGSVVATAGTATNRAANIVSVGNGWYRCSVAGIGTGVAANAFAQINQSTSSSATDDTYTGNGTSGLLLWGAQLEAVTYQTTPGTYNSTTPKNLLGYTQEFDNAAWTKSNSFVQTNLLLQSEALGTSWTASSATVTSNSTTAPNGTATADTLASTGAGGRLTQNVTAPTTGSYTASVYVQAGTVSTFELLLRNNNTATNIAQATFNLANGTVSATTAGTAAITNVGGGWYRVSVTSSGGVTAADLLITYLYAGSSSNTSGNSVILWGAQLVQGATAGDYQPTYAAAAAVQYAAPDGTLSADKLVETTAAGVHNTGQSITTVVAPYTFSTYIKAAERTFAIVYHTQSNAGIYINLSNGTSGTAAGTSAPVSSSVTAVGNGWYRCSISVNATTASNFFGVYSAPNSTTTSYTGDGTSGIYVWGAQLSNSASLDPYVYNPGAAPTSAAYYAPRFDYDPVTLAPKGLLIEEQRTNRTLYSEDFTGAAWAATVVGTSTRVNDGAPLGFTRGLITATSATGGIRQTHAGLTSGQVYALSFYIQSTATSVQVVFENGTAGFGAGHNVTINPSNGTAGVLTGFTRVSITPFGPGYVYTLITGAAGGLLIANIEWRITNSGDSIRLGRPQFEAGSFATSYIPTVASQVTRTADVAQMLGTNFSSWYNANAGTIVANADTIATTGTRSIMAPSTGGNFLLYISNFNYAGEYDGANLTLTANQTTQNTAFKAASSYGSGGMSVVLNNGTVATGSYNNAFAPIVAVFLGTNAASGALNGHIRSIQYYNTRLPNDQLQAISA